MSAHASSAVRIAGRRAGGPSLILRRALSARPMYEAVAPLVHAVLAAIGLILLSPLFLLIALAIKATSRGPVFYRGERVGVHARRFRICKFRTMVEGAEGQIGGRLATGEDKERYCTRIGRLLKKTKLDELPQLLNVVRGEMRLVGPRPIRPVFLAGFARELSGYTARFRVPPGITGIAQLRGGYYTTPRDKLRYDLIYIARRSLRLDVLVVALTFVKILNRWLATGVLVLGLFLFVSLIPAGLHAGLGLDLFGVQVSAVSVFIVVAAVWAALRRRSDGFALYRCPLNLALMAFAALTAAAALSAADPRPTLEGAGYYAATGLVLAFLIVNSLATRAFLLLTVRVVALTSVSVSLLGFARLFVANYAAGLEPGEIPRLTSVVGNPVALAVYLGLGIPILLAEVTAARSRRARDLWLVCATISSVGVVFTQTRMGLLALLVSGLILLRGHRQQAVVFAVALMAGIALLGLTFAPRLAPAELAADVLQWTHNNRLELGAVSVRQWLLGGGWSGERDGVPNMHVTLVREHGVLGWLLFMWVIVATLRAMKRAHDRVRDRHLRRVLWAIISSVAGFLVSMNAMNTFHHLPIQIFFWCLIGIGQAIVVHLGRPRPRNVIWRFGDAGD